MRFLAIMLLVIFAVIFVFWGMGSWSCNQPPKPNGEAQQSDGTKHENCTTLYGTVVVGLHDAGDFVHVFREEIVAVSTFFIAIFTVILSVFTVSLAHATKRTAEHIPRVERAYVHGGPGQGRLVQAATNTALHLTITINNFGKTPAFVKDICWDVHDNTAFRSPDFTKNRKYLDMFIKDGVIYKTPVEIQITTVSLLYLLIRYEDMFGGLHETGLTYRIVPRVKEYAEPVEGVGAYRKWT